MYVAATDARIIGMNELSFKDRRWLHACSLMASVMGKCSKAQYFCFVIDRYGRIRGAGYNGTPSGLLDCIDGGCPRAINNVASSTPYDTGDGLCWAIHAEVNALMGVDREILEGASLYVNGAPCVQCAKHIAGSGVRRVISLKENRPDTPLVRHLFKELNIDFHEVVTALEDPSPTTPPPVGGVADGVGG